MDSPVGYHRITWNQLRSADVALWNHCALKCERGTKATSTDARTAFEQAWLEGMKQA